MKTKEQIQEWILKNCVDENGDIDLAFLDFSEFDGDIIITNMKVKNNLYQGSQVVQGSLYQGSQVVQGSLYQGSQEVCCNLKQQYQDVDGDLYQDNQDVDGNIYQDTIINGKTYRQSLKELKEKYGMDEYE